MAHAPQVGLIAGQQGPGQGGIGLEQGGKLLPGDGEQNGVGDNLGKQGVGPGAQHVVVQKTAGAQEKHDLPAVGLGDGIEGHHPTGDKVDGVLVGVQALKAPPGQIGPTAVVFHLEPGGQIGQGGLVQILKKGDGAEHRGGGGQAVHENAPYYTTGRKERESGL